MRKKFNRLLLALTYVTTLFAFAAPVAALDNGKIVYRSNDGDTEISVIDSDGSNVVQLTDNIADDLMPKWSPSGKKIAFVSDRDGDPEIFTMNADGSNVVQLTDNTVANYSPEWSPDGTNIAYTQAVDLGPGTAYEIFTMNADGSNQQQISTGGVDGDGKWDLSWSSDVIAFRFHQNISDHGIYTIDATPTSPPTSTTARLSAAAPRQDYWPAYSPNGSTIAYQDDTTHLYTMNSDGSSPAVLVAANSTNPAWSPDGNTIVFEDVALGLLFTVPASGGSTSSLGEIGDQPDWGIAAPVSTVNNGKTTSTIAEGESYMNTDYTVVSNEDLIVNGTIRNVTINSGGTLKGTGTVGTITVAGGGTLAPGESPGCLSSGDLTLSSSSTFEVEIEGTTVCTEYDQQQVTGTVDVTDATLDIQKLSSFNPAVNDEFIIIDNDSNDAVTGAFENFAEGATQTIDGATFQITYTGGDGNDVVLTVTDVAAAVSGDEEAPDTGIGLALSNPLFTLVASTLSAITIFGLKRKLTN